PRHTRPVARRTREVQTPEPRRNPNPQVIATKNRKIPGQRRPAESRRLRRQVHAARLRWGDHVPDGPEYAETAEPERIRRREKSAPAWLVLGGRIMGAQVPGAGSVPQVGPPRVARPVAARRASRLGYCAAGQRAIGRPSEPGRRKRGQHGGG